MKSRFPIALLLVCAFSISIIGQKRPVSVRRINAEKSPSKSRETGNRAVVVDETLSVLRLRPSLFADSIQRMRRGRIIQILETKEADGVTFYRVAAPPNNSGWVQSEAVFGAFRRGDDERLAKLIQATNGFDQLEIIGQFLEIFPNSSLRPAILLLFGDLAEEIAAKLSRDATKKLDRREMAASGAPLHSYYLNFVSLDRYRKLGIVFLFNAATKTFHYNGASWSEITQKFPKLPEAVEARKRLDAIKEKLEKTSAK